MKLAVAQFESKDGHKIYNLSVIDELTKKAKNGGADVVCFHELSITAYTHLQGLDIADIRNISEPIPTGESVQKLLEISAKHEITVLAGLVEEEEGKFFNTFICVNKNGVVAKYRKLHPFISKYLSAGNEYVVFDLLGWKCAILICYDNNIIENVRAVTLLGAELIFAPHVTGCTPSTMPGRGYVDDTLWKNRLKDPKALRKEFDGPKGRGWLMRWLPARAYDNGVYYAFSNPIGYDGGHLKNGNAMVLDPYGEVLAETKTFDNEIAIAEIHKNKIPLSGGYRYRNARRPELYKNIIGEEHVSTTLPVWMTQDKKGFKKIEQE